jgi:catalase
LNIHPALAATVANGLGMTETPTPAKAAKPTRNDLPVSDALSIINRGPTTFEGRKLGILLTDGADAGLFAALVKAASKAGAVVEAVTPKIAGAVLSDGTLAPGKQKLDGGPSVLFDAVALLLSEAGAALLAKDGPARDFVADAFSHCKFIGYTAAAEAMLAKAGDPDGGCVALATAKDAASFVEACGQLRYWPRETVVDMDAKG